MKKAELFFMPKHCPTRAMTAITGRVPVDLVPPCENCTCGAGSYGYPTTRRHPRTTIEAFNDAERATWRHGPYRPHGRLIRRVSDSLLRWAALGFALVAVLLAISNRS